MSGETQANVSAFTIDSLHLHLQRQINDLGNRLQERYDTQTKALDAALDAQQDATSTAFSAQQAATAAALAAAEKAVQAALAAAEKAITRVEAKIAEIRADAERVDDKAAKGVEAALRVVSERQELHAVNHEHEHEAHQRLHDFAQVAIDKAEARLEERLKGMNEFRAALNDQQKNSVSQVTFDAVKETASLALVQVRDDIAAIRTFAAGKEAHWVTRDYLEQTIQASAKVDAKRDEEIVTIRNELAATRGKAGAYTAMMGVGITVVIIIVNVLIAFYLQ